MANVMCLVTMFALCERPFVMTETALDAAFCAMQSGDEVMARRFYRLLADTPLFLLLAEEATGEAITPQVFELTDGPVILAFDSEERLAGFQDGPVPFASLPGRVIASLMAADEGRALWLGLNLDTGAASETLLPPDAMGHLLALLDVSPDQAEAQARAFAAPLVPEALDEALRFALTGASGLAAGAVLVAVTYAGGARGHVLALVGTPEAAQAELARAMAEALSFAGLEAAALDVTFLAPEAPALAQMRKVGRIYEVPKPAPKDAAPIPAAPGSDPSKPPRLR